MGRLETGTGNMKISVNGCFEDIEGGYGTKGTRQTIPVGWGFIFKGTSANFFPNSIRNKKVGVLCVSEVVKFHSAALV